MHELSQPWHFELHTSASHELQFLLLMFVVTASAAAAKAEEALSRSHPWPVATLASLGDDCAGRHCHYCSAGCKLLFQWTGLHITLYVHTSLRLDNLQKTHDCQFDTLMPISYHILHKAFALVSPRDDF